MKFFYDTEFLEGKIAHHTLPSIQLISIAIVAENGQSYYEFNSQFDISAAWNRNDGSLDEPNYWLRDNVLKKAWQVLSKFHLSHDKNRQYDFATEEFSFDGLSWLLQLYGKSEYQLAQEIEKFIPQTAGDQPIEMVGYYSAYDHVVFCWLFGRMLDLPKGFPMYTYDLKQRMDDIAHDFSIARGMSFDESLAYLKDTAAYPVQDKDQEHDALDDARWTQRLYEYLNNVTKELFV